MKKLLILHNRPDANSNLIWKAAISNGWKTFRHIASDDLLSVCEGYDMVRYYGNTLHAEYMPGKPFQFHVIPPDFIQQVYRLNPDYVGRSVVSARLSDIAEPLTTDLFVKPVYQKYFEARVYRAGERVSNSATNPQDWCYIQGIINPIDEIRCFVVDGKILTASTYRQNKVFECEYIPEPPSEVITMVSDICSKLNIAYGVVLDFARLDTGKWVFLEVNESWASGIYDNDPVKCLECIAKSQY
jgi:hypothetical protein